MYEEGNVNQLGTRIFVHMQIRSAVKRVKFINPCVSCIALKGQLCDIIVVNVHAPSQIKIDHIKYSISEEIQQLFNQLPVHHMKIPLGDFNAKVR